MKRPLPYDKVSKRDGPGGKKLSYATTETIASAMNDTFPLGWSREIVAGTLQKVGEKMWQCVVRVTLVEFGVVHEDVGHGTGPDDEKAAKEAVSDATKRACHMLGKSVGLSLYDSDFLAAVPNQKTTQKQ